jgi:hypothetical protein
VASRREFLKSAALAGASFTAAPLLGGLQASGGKASEVITLGPDRQLFVDNYLIEDMRGARAVLHEARKYDSNPILKADRPWEKGVFINSGGPAVLYDREVARFKMWYFTYAAAYTKGTHLAESFVPSYATSADGEHWEKPDLGLVEYGGSTRNSILPWPSQIWNGSNNVIYDLHDPNPGRRYKSVYYGTPPRIRFDAGPEAVFSWDTRNQSAAGLFVSFSPDGIHWDDYLGNPVLSSKMIHDTHSLLGWDERVQKYVGYFRPAFELVEERIRVIGRSESTDFIHWTEPSKQIILRPDSQDARGTEFYCMAAMSYQGCYLGLVWVYHNDPHWPWPKGVSITDKELSPHQQTLDAQLVTSRDGIHWERSAKRDAIIPVGPPGSWDDGVVYPSTPVVVGDEVWAYYGGANMRHTGESLGSEGQVVEGVRKTAGVGLAKWRLDGFVSIDSEGGDGSLTTKPLSFSGDQLWLNADASKGSIAVEVLDERHQPVPGFTKAASVPLKTAAVRQRVLWSGNGPSLGTLAGKPVRFKFHLQNAGLYSFWTAS